MHTQQLLMEMKSEQDHWQNRIRFYRDEIKQFDDHLSKISVSEAPRETMVSVEHFQNQFIRQKEVLDITRHDFKQHENLLEAIEKNVSTEPLEGIQKMHSMQREKMEQFERIFHELRNEFNFFLDQVAV